jgi:predicted dithiol-disulfide oxidoreductase (DUF899 family)
MTEGMHRVRFPGESDLWGGSRRLLLGLFADGKDTLFLYSFMVVGADQGLPFVGPCPSCASIIDGADGAVPHLTQQLNVAVASKAPIELLADHAATRGWRHARLLSSADTD